MPIKGAKMLDSTKEKIKATKKANPFVLIQEDYRSGKFSTQQLASKYQVSKSAAKHVKEV